MSLNIGVLLPKSTDYPSMAFDLLDGLRLSLKESGIEDFRLITENIGFGEDRNSTYSKAEKLFIQDEAQLIVAYMSVQNAEPLYNLAESASRPMIFIDPSMNTSEVPVNPMSVFISLQGIEACRLIAEKNTVAGMDAVMATSFYDGGYRGPWAFSKSLEKTGGKIVGNFVCHYKESEFSMATLKSMIEENQTKKILACYSTYLAALLLKKLNEEGGSLPSAVYYCSSFMAEEQMLSGVDFPGGEFYAYTHWSRSLDIPANRTFMELVKKEKNKSANIFHLAGWEGGMIATKILSETQAGKTPQQAIQDLSTHTFDSPRGRLTIDPENNTAYSPLYYGRMHADENGKGIFSVLETRDMSLEEHRSLREEKPSGLVSGWFNNYLCT